MSERTEGSLPSPEGKKRVRKGIELFKQGTAKSITMIGKRHGTIPQDITHAEAMKRYALAILQREGRYKLDFILNVLKEIEKEE